MQSYRTISKVAFVVATFALLASCGNTVRGIGRDTANAVNATKHAGQEIADSF